MDRKILLATIGAMTALVGASLADAAEMTLRHPAVTLFGTVERVSNAHEFTLRDNNGRVTVRLRNELPILDEGDSVTVTGNAVKGDANIIASQVSIHRRAAT
jgi:cytochrome c-type biogenesis protein CcmE